MIAAYNRKQKRLATLNRASAVFLLLFSITFFFTAFFFILTAFGFAHQEGLVAALTAGAILIVIITGIRSHQSGFGHYSYQESDLFTGLDYRDAGTRSLRGPMGVAGCSHILTQLFLAAPLQWLRGRERLASLIREDPTLDKNLQILLDEINSQAQWIPIKKYQDRSEELTHLIQMEAIQFSPRKSVIHRN